MSKNKRFLVNPGSSPSNEAQVVKTVKYAVDLDDVVYTNLQAGDTLVFDGVSWTNQQLSILYDITGDYCPGYPFVYLNQNQWKIADLDLTNLYYIGKRARFVYLGSQANDVFGEITNSVYTPGDGTTITMSMENNQILSNNITTVCLATSDTVWATIASAKFSEDIVDMVIEVASGFTRFMVVTTSGKILRSIDKGVTWQVVYDNAGVTSLTGIDMVKNTKAFYVSDFDHLLKSVDGGDTWTIVQYIPANGTQYTLVACTDDYVGIRYGGGTWRSSNDDFVTVQSPNNPPPANTLKVVLGALADIVLYISTNSTEYGSYSTPNFTYAAVSAMSSGFPGGADVLNGAFLSKGAYPDAAMVVGRANNINVTNNLDNGSFGTNYTANFGTTDILCVAYSPLLDIIVIAGGSGKMSYVTTPDLTDPANWNWVAISSGFPVTSDILFLDWSVSESMFIAITNKGEVATSSNGIN